MENNIGDIVRQYSKGRTVFENETNGKPMVIFKNNGMAGGVPLAIHGTSEGYVFSALTSSSITSSVGRAMAAFGSRVNDVCAELGSGLDRSTRICRSSGTANAHVGLGRDLGDTSTNETLVRIANRASTATLNLDSTVNYFEIIDYDTTLSTRTELFRVSSDRKIHLHTQTIGYDTTDSTSPTTGALIVSGGVGIAKNLFVGLGITTESSTDQYPVALNIRESSHASSRRAALSLGTVWQVLQDTDGNGTKDFGLYSSALAAFPLRISTGGLFSLSSGVGVNAILDEDNMASNSATAVPTQQSVKAYIDANVDGKTLKTTINQSAHGFVVGDVLRHNGSAWVKSQADSAVNSDVLGIVESSIDSDNFVLVYWGEITLSGLTAGAEYYLSATTAGATTTTAPSTVGQIVRSLMTAISTTKAIVRIQNPGVQVV